jgi:hypothetical protein
MAKDRIHEMAGNGADIEARTPKVPDSDARNGTRQPVIFNQKMAVFTVLKNRSDIQKRKKQQCMAGLPIARATEELPRFHRQRMPECRLKSNAVLGLREVQPERR